MKNFTYHQPATVEAAVGLLAGAEGKAELLAGGTDLMDLMKEYVAQPDKLISLSAIPGPDFNTIIREQGDKNILIGAMVKLSTIAENEMLRKLFPGLTSAAGIIGGPQIRNMGTLGGNLCQRNRCWYYRDEHVNCLLKGGRRCYAIDGENQYHAIFTKGHPCVIVNPSTLAPVLIALGAQVQVAGRQGRAIPLAEFFRAPSKPEHREHNLTAGEIVTQVKIPMNDLANASYEVRHKQSHDWPLVQAAVAFKFAGGRASNAKIVLGHVAPTPHIAADAAKAIEGKEINETTAAEAGKAAAKGAEPLSQNAYKVKLVEVAVKRALLTAAGAQRYWEV